MDQKSINVFLYRLYDEDKAATVSVQCRKKYHAYSQNSLIYGNSHLPSLYEIFSKVKPCAGEVFYDLGSGSGRVVLFAALSFPFMKCVGIELVDELVRLAKDQLKLMQGRVPNLEGYDPSMLGEIEFIRGDLTKVDVSDADVVYTASTCFDEKLILALANSLEKQVAKGTRVITLAKSLPSKEFKVFYQQLCPMEWGETTIYFQERV